jgi:uncharacterized protein (TIGR03435 family)
MFRSLAPVFLITGIAIGQSERAPLRFEVCDIQFSKIKDPKEMKADFLPGGRVDVRGVSMKTIIAVVNKVPEDFVSGPGWMSSTRYDIVAKAVPTSTEDQLFAMTRTMLLERFKMVSHTVKKPAPAYVMTVGKKSANLTPSTDANNPGCQVVPSTRTEPTGLTHRACHAVTMQRLAELLPEMAPAYFQDLLAVDLTELKGAFDFKLDWVSRPAYNAAVAAANGGTPTDDRVVTIFDAVQKLGLKLENRKYPMDMIVVDSIERTPTEN